MTNKEKAEELIDFILNIKPIKLGDYSRIYHPTAKIIAIKMIDEILIFLKTSTDVQTSLNAIKHWEDLKEEIENL